MPLGGRKGVVADAGADCSRHAVSAQPVGYSVGQNKTVKSYDVYVRVDGCMYEGEKHCTHILPNLNFLVYLWRFV